jgi:hypothetical protein
MRLVTSLPFPHIAFRHWTPDDSEGAVIIVKGSFGINSDGTLFLAPEQAPLVEVDVFHGDPATSSLLAEQDLAPDKPRTDVTFALTARAPNGEAMPDWPVSVEIEGRAFYGFHVRGPSFWQKQPSGSWRLTAPQPVQTVPIRYELAFGGQAMSDDPPSVHLFNPAGTGFVTDRSLREQNLIPAPQIGELAEFVAGDVRAEMTVHGLGPIAKAWLPRRAEAGTFDEAWKSARHPRMPADYSFAFWNAAPRRLQIDPYLRGGERILLRGFHAALEPQIVTLPAVGLTLRNRAGALCPMNLTDVQIDMDSEDPANHRVALIWRRFLGSADSEDTLHIETATIEAPAPETTS